jgi:general secretion pathway protein I
MRRGPERGFTLVEVMVALAVVAVAVPALLFTLDQQIDGTAYLRDRSLAQVVAVNRLAELRLAQRGAGAALRGESAGSEVMAGRDWYWRVAAASTEVPGFARVEIRVSDRTGDDAAALYTLVAFVAASVGSGDAG